MDQELKAYLDERETRMDKRFSQLQAQMDERETQMDKSFSQLRAHMDERFTQVETEVRHTRVLVEGLDNNMRLIAEAVVGTNERIDRLQVETASKLHEIKDAVQRGLVPRIEILESRVDRANRDILDVVRERYVPRQAQQPR